MALLDDIFEGNLGTGLVAAVGVAVLGPILLPALRRTAKIAIKGGLMAYDYGKGAMAELQEAAGDMAAEVRAEAAGAEAGAGRATSQPRTTKSG